MRRRSLSNSDLCFLRRASPAKREQFGKKQSNFNTSPKRRGKCNPKTGQVCGLSRGKGCLLLFPLPLLSFSHAHTFRPLRILREDEFPCFGGEIFKRRKKEISTLTALGLPDWTHFEWEAKECRMRAWAWLPVHFRFKSSPPPRQTFGAIPVEWEEGFVDD